MKPSNPNIWEPLTIESVSWKTERGDESTIKRFANLRRAQRVVRAWATPLFRRAGGWFEVRWLDGNVRAATLSEVALMFDLELSEPKRPAKPKAVAVRPPVQQSSKPEPPRADGKIPVRKQILHRGRTFTVTYWKKPGRIAA